MVVLGIFFAIVALSPGARVRGAFGRGSGESVPANKTGRVILLIVAVVFAFVGVQAIFH